MDDSYKAIADDCALTPAEYASLRGLGDGADEESVRLNVAIRATLVAKEAFKAEEARWRGRVDALREALAEERALADGYTDAAIAADRGR